MKIYLLCTVTTVIYIIAIHHLFNTPASYSVCYTCRFTLLKKVKGIKGS